MKWLADPYALLGVYLLLVVFVLDRFGDAPALSLACAIVPFQLVMMTVLNALGAVNLRSSIVLNMSFDRMLIPLSSAVTESVGFIASLTLVALTMAAHSVAPTMAILWLPLVIAMNFVFATACAYAASLIGLWFREVRPFVISFVRAMFFLAPGLVQIEEVPEGAQRLIKVNPLSGLFESYRSVLVDGHRPSSWQLLYPLGTSLLLLAVALPLYRRERHHFAKVVE